MRKMNCRNVRREIEEAATDELLDAPANDHLMSCVECGTFREERLKLREMLSSLGSVEAPGDFDFRLRARLANEEHGRTRDFAMRSLSFGFRSAMVALLVLLIGVAMFLNLRTSPNDSLSATKPVETLVDGAGQESVLNSTSTAVVAPMPSPSTGPHEKAVRGEQIAGRQRNGLRQTQVASLRSDSARRWKALDLSSTGAPVLRPQAMNVTESNAFPLGTAYQSLKVSLDDGRGTSRTISLPSVSFGSQRVLSQNSSSLLASARSDW